MREGGRLCVAAYISPISPLYLPYISHISPHYQVREGGRLCVAASHLSPPLLVRPAESNPNPNRHPTLPF